MSRPQLDRVAANSEAASHEIHVVAPVLQRHQIGHQLALLDTVAPLQAEGHRRVGLDRADTVDAGHAGDDDHVVTLHYGAGRRMAHAVDLLVDGRILLDIGVGPRDVGFGLVVIVVGDEILDRVVREEALELAVELRGERLVGSKDQRGPLGALDHLRHGEGLARAGNAEQDLIAFLRLGLRNEFGDGLWLIALRHHVRLELQRDAAFGLLRAQWPMRDERQLRSCHQRMVLDQRLRRFAETRLPAVAGNRHAGCFTGDGAGLGARSECLGRARGHVREYGGDEGR